MSIVHVKTVTITSAYCYLELHRMDMECLHHFDVEDVAVVVLKMHSLRIEITKIGVVKIEIMMIETMRIVYSGQKKACFSEIGIEPCIFVTTFEM